MARLRQQNSGPAISRSLIMGRPLCKSFCTRGLDRETRALVTPESKVREKISWDECVDIPDFRKASVSWIVKGRSFASTIMASALRDCKKRQAARAVLSAPITSIFLPAKSCMLPDLQRTQSYHGAEHA